MLRQPRPAAPGIASGPDGAGATPRPGLTQSTGRKTMPKADTIPTTSRRSALRGISLANIAAGLAAPALATPTPTSPDADAELIRLVRRDRRDQAQARCGVTQFGARSRMNVGRNRS
jgi:hypothetical protein